MNTRIAKAVLLLGSILTSANVAALPKVTDLDTPAVPSTLDITQLTANQPILVALPSGQYRLNGAASSPAPGMTSLTAYSDDRSTRLYAFSADGSIQSAHIYGAAGHWQLVNSGEQQYWAPGRSLDRHAGLQRAEPRASSKQLRLSSLANKAPPDENGIYEVRVLALYTAAASLKLGGERAMEIEAQRINEFANGVYTANQLPVRLVLTQTAPFFDANEEQDFYGSLDAMVGNSYVTGLRDQTQSDLIVLFRGPGKLCGLSSGFDGSSVAQDYNDPPQNVDPERDAFNVVSIDCGEDTYAHEIGHSFSGGHDLASIGGAHGAYWKPYAHALPCPTIGLDGIRYFSMMWGKGVGPGVNIGEDDFLRSGGRGDIITNANAMPMGVPCGMAGIEGIEATQADNARAMREAIPYVAGYRGANNARQTNAKGGQFGGAFQLPILLLAWALRRYLNRDC